MTGLEILICTISFFFLAGVFLEIYKRY